MKISNQVWSIRQISLTLIVSFVIIFSVMEFFLISTQSTKAFNALSTSYIKHWSMSLSEKSKKYIIANDKNKLIKYFELVKDIPYINFIHIYTTNNNDSNGELKLFYSYKHNVKGTSIKNQSPRLKQLATPQFNYNHIEFMQPIKVENKIIGYIYLQNSTKMYTTFKSKLIYIVVLSACIIMFISLLVAFLFERYINAGFQKLAYSIQYATKSDTLPRELDAMPYLEANILASNILTFIEHIQKKINRLKENETKHIKHTQELENIISSRTSALKDSNQELLSTLEKMHEYQGQIIENEKMSSLGELVAGVAHEVNTPIGLGVTASSLLADRLHEIDTAFHEKTLKSSQLKKFLEDGNDNIKIIIRNLNRAADLISSFKQVAVDQSDEQNRSLNMKKLIDEVLLTLKPKLQALPYVIDIDCPEDLIITSKAGPINQILINLIMNSVIHAFEDREHGNIAITIMPLGKQLNIIYQDDGIGINETIKHKVFEPFTTTKRGEGGSGLGLHLVYNLVTQALGGTIDLSSEINNGVTIEINFPISM